jgi:hypothetical protein
MLWNMLEACLGDVGTCLRNIFGICSRHIFGILSEAYLGDVGTYLRNIFGTWFATYIWHMYEIHFFTVILVHV